MGQAAARPQEYVEDKVLLTAFGRVMTRTTDEASRGNATHSLLNMLITYSGVGHSATLHLFAHIKYAARVREIFLDQRAGSRFYDAQTMHRPQQALQGHSARLTAQVVCPLDQGLGQGEAGRL